MQKVRPIIPILIFGRSASSQPVVLAVLERRIPDGARIAGMLGFDLRSESRERRARSRGSLRDHARRGDRHCVSRRQIDALIPFEVAIPAISVVTLVGTSADSRPETILETVQRRVRSLPSFPDLASPMPISNPSRNLFRGGYCRQ
jgi:hypothetical protein